MNTVNPILYYKDIKKWDLENKSSIHICGSTGSLKTLFSLKLGNEFRKQGYTLVVVTDEYPKHKVRDFLSNMNKGELSYRFDLIDKNLNYICRTLQYEYVEPQHPEGTKFVFVFDSPSIDINTLDSIDYILMTLKAKNIDYKVISTSPTKNFNQEIPYSTISANKIQHSDKVIHLQRVGSSIAELRVLKNRHVNIDETVTIKYDFNSGTFENVNPRFFIKVWNTVKNIFK